MLTFHGRAFARFAARYTIFLERAPDSLKEKQNALCSAIACSLGEHINELISLQSQTFWKLMKAPLQSVRKAIGGDKVTDVEHTAAAASCMSKMMQAALSPAKSLGLPVVRGYEADMASHERLLESHASVRDATHTLLANWEREGETKHNLDAFCEESFRFWEVLMATTTASEEARGDIAVILTFFRNEGAKFCTTLVGQEDWMIKMVQKFLKSDKVTWPAGAGSTEGLSEAQTRLERSMYFMEQENKLLPPHLVGAGGICLLKSWTLLSDIRAKRAAMTQKGKTNRQQRLDTCKEMVELKTKLTAAAEQADPQFKMFLEAAQGDILALVVE